MKSERSTVISNLADRLLSSLDGDILSDVDAAWIAEAEHRYHEYKEGKRQDVAAKGYNLIDP